MLLKKNTKKMLRREMQRLTIFGLVGVGATTIHLIIAQIVLLINGNPLISSSFGFLPAFVFSYLGHRHFTFGDATRGSITRFLIISMVGFLVSLLFLTKLQSLPSWIGLTISIGIIPLWSYFMSRIWVFKFDRS